jgi:uncharacterized protein (DUF433 family)
MQLPEFLQDHDGEIRLTGHRVGLVHLVKLYNDGQSAEMIAASLPTLSLSLVHRVIAFYLDHQAEVDAHAVAHDQIMDALEAESRQSEATPSVAELRRRLNTMRPAGQG